MVFEHLTFVELHVHEPPDDVDRSQSTRPDEEPTKSGGIPRPPVGIIFAIVGVSIGVSLLATILTKRVFGPEDTADDQEPSDPAVVEVTE